MPLSGRYALCLPTWLSIGIAACSLFATSALNAAELNNIRIHRFASFDSQLMEQGAKHANSTSGSRAAQRTQLNVFNRQLRLTLEDNQTVLESLPANSRHARVLRGQLEGNNQSWVRLTHADDGTHGLIWDGAELYVVEPGDSIRSALSVAAGLPSNDTVIFRLSDTTVDLGAEYCGSADDNNHPAGQASATTGLATYEALTAELSAQAIATGTPTLRLEMLALADAAFRAQYNSDQAALDALTVRMNNIDGIFSSQLGLEVQATDVQMYASDPLALGNSTDASTLLSALGQLRKSSPVMSSYAVTHLFTGRDLDGDTLGIAYIGNICNARYGASLSEVRNRGAWIDSLIAAHELGHQLGAVHDGTGSCSSTPAQGYLMDAKINGSNIFSQCSQDTLLQTMQYAACLVPVGKPDLTISAAASPLSVAPDSVLQWLVPIKNIGTGTANYVSVHISLPAAVTVSSSSIPGGSCISSNNTGSIDCQFDGLAANETRQLDIRLSSSSKGAYLLNTEVVTLDDANTGNDHTSFNLSVGIETPAATTAATNVSTSNGTSDAGGGGSFSPGWLGLMLLGAMRRWLRIHQQA